MFRKPENSLVGPDDKIEKLWEKSDDKVGIKPLFTVRCRFCYSWVWWKPWTWFRHTRMFVRWSNVLLPVYSGDVFAQDICYKCSKCDYVAIFGVPLPLGYSQEILNRRDNQKHYVPYDAWLDDEQVRKQLETFGYA